MFIFAYLFILILIDNYILTLVSCFIISQNRQENCFNQHFYIINIKTDLNLCYLNNERDQSIFVCMSELVKL